MIINGIHWVSFYKWEMADLSDIFSSSALNFYVRNVPKIQITLILTEKNVGLVK